ncbi:hypothetical protein BGX34_006677 [Mortierella sp. NVP85]|nr:hypothetical protein BGX34_006677 [Mortierella sp. NVP85]
MHLKSMVSFYLGLATVLLGTVMNVVTASPVSQQYHLGQLEQDPVFPTGSATILDILAGLPEFTKLLKAIKEHEDLIKLLLTLFAPTNEAFDSVSDIDYPMHEVLLYHISDQAYSSSALHKEFIVSSLLESPGLNNAHQLLRISLEKPDVPSPSFGAFAQEKPSDRTSLYVNHAKVIIPDLMSRSGGVVHGVDRIIRPPGETILDEIERNGDRFTLLNKAWTSTGVDARIRDGKDMTLFAANDQAWEALPKKLVEWLFSNMGREHLKIFALYQIANRAVYTPEIFNKTREDGTPEKNYHDVPLQSLLNSPKFVLHVRAQVEKAEMDLDLVYPPNHRRHRHQKQPHNGGGKGGHKRPRPHPTPRRDEICINQKACVLHGYENWVAGNGVIHVVDTVLMPPRDKGCEGMPDTDCAAWEHMWELSEDQELKDDQWWDDMVLFDLEE